MVTGTHGDKPENPVTGPGSSGLTDKDCLDESFYKRDCERIGIKPGTNINVPAVKMDDPPRGSFYENEEMSEMDIRLANMTTYNDKKDLFTRHINEETFEKSLNL